MRPLITKEDIENVISHCPENGGCVVGKKIYDTIKKVNEDLLIVETISRDSIWISQTPQAFCLKTLINCYSKGFDNFTDEASLLESNKHDVKIIESVNTNIKITTKKDLQITEQLLSTPLTLSLIHI